MVVFLAWFSDKKDNNLTVKLFTNRQAAENCIEYHGNGQVFEEKVLERFRSCFKLAA